MNKFAIAAPAAAMVLAMAFSPAQARPDTRNMTCQQAVTIVAQYNAIVMTTGQYTYDRIVENRGYCSATQEARPLYAPTVDVDKCNVGKKCHEKLDE